MAKFPIIRARETISGRGPGVRANIDVRTGGQERAQAIAGFGGALFELGLKYDITQAQTELSKFQRQANEEINRLPLSFDTNLDPETYRPEYDKTMATIDSLMPSNRRAARNAQLWLNAREPVWSRNVDKMRLARADDNWLAELFEKQAVVSQTGKIGSFPAYIAEGIKAGRINKSDAVKILATTKNMAVQAQEKLLSDALYEQAKVLPIGKRIQHINNVKGIPRQIRNDAIARIERQNEIETATTNPKVRWDTLRLLTKDPRLVTDDYLESLVKPNSLTWDDTEEFKKIRDRENDPLKSPRAQLYFNMLRELYNKREEDSNKGREQAYQWDIANEKLTIFFKNNPNATAKQASEFYNEVIEPAKRNFLDKMWRYLLMWPPFPLPLGEELKEKIPILGKGGLPKREKRLTIDVARFYLDMADGDREKAKQMAADDGYIE